MPRRNLAVSAALALLGFACPARAQIVPPSVLPGLGVGGARQTVDVNRPPWRGVVRVQTELGAHCTGALIGPRLVLTAAHCLFGRSTGRVVRPGSIHVLTGFDHGAFTGHGRAVAVEIGPGFALGPDGQRLPAAPADADWARLTLDTTLGTNDRVLPLAPTMPPSGTPAMLGGYEQDYAQIMIADTECRVLGPVRIGAATLLRHSCAATRGASGGPLLAQVPGLGWAVVGVAATAAVGTAGGYAVPISAIATRP